MNSPHYQSFPYFKMENEDFEVNMHQLSNLGKLISPSIFAGYVLILKQKHKMTRSAGKRKEKREIQAL